MKTTIAPPVLAAVCLVGSVWSASPMVALRVELVPRAGVEAGSEVTVAVEVAPEDRARLGPRGFLTATLSVGETVRARSQQTVELVDGRAELVATWPPGRFELRVDVEGSASGDRGVWIGTIDVPRLAPRATATPAATAAPPPAGPVAADAPPLPSRALPTTPAPPRTELPTVAAATTASCTLTVLASDDRHQPVRDLSGDDFAVELAGRPATVTGFSGPGAPLHLALVVAAPDELAPFAAASRRAVLRLAETALASGGQVVLEGAGPSAWTTEPEELERALAAIGPGPTPVPARVAAALARLAGVAGRRAVVVVVGAGDAAERAEWDAAIHAASQAGVPVLTLVAAADDLPQRLRSRLRDLAERSGGRSYTLRGEDLVDLTAALYRSLLEASVALTVAAPAAPAKVEVATRRAAVTLSHSAALACR